MDVQTHVGRRWHKEIEKELHAARAVVVLWSATSRDSDFVLEEAEYGKRKEILFPAFIERVEFPYGFGRIQTADLIGWAGDTDHPGLAELLASLKEHLNSREATPRTGNVIHTDPVVTSKPVQPAPARVLAPGQTFRDRLKTGADGPLMVVIPAGRFRMGSPADEPERSDNEGPQHEVRIAAPFAMGVYAVTFEDYERFCDDTKRGKPEDKGWGRGSRPVINVSWEDAQDYCAWLSRQTGRNYRLPSEAEWEYACRAGTDTPFHFGPRITTDQANFDGNYTYNGSAKGEYRTQTVPVGSFPPNAFGLYDMHGNVWEWCRGHVARELQRRPERRFGLGRREKGVPRAARRVLGQSVRGAAAPPSRHSTRSDLRSTLRRVSCLLCGPRRIADRSAADHWIAAALNTERRSKPMFWIR